MNFTPWFGLAGGLLIGIAATVLLLLNGRVAGVSGILGGLLIREGRGEPKAEDVGWRVWFISGLLAGGAVLYALVPSNFGSSPVSLPVVIVAGLLVGFGTRLGSGCTSGHGVCGLSRLSLRSLVATMTFMFTAVVTTFVVRHVIGAAP